MAKYLDENGLASLWGKIKAYVSSNGGGVTVDSSLSSSSTNPVQNKVINTALANKEDKISQADLDTISDNLGGITDMSLANALKVMSYDSGWIDVAQFSGCQPYNSGDSKPQYRRVGKVVELTGAVKSLSAYMGSATAITMFTLPLGFRPASLVVSVQQGSGQNIHTVRVLPTGVVSIERCRDGSGYSQVTTSSWLNHSGIRFITDDPIPS